MIKSRGIPTQLLVQRLLKFQHQQIYKISSVAYEKNSIENESQVQTPTNYHQRIKIQNTKSKSRAEKVKSRSIRPMAVNYNNVQIENLEVTVPGNRLYSSITNYGNKKYV